MKKWLFGILLMLAICYLGFTYYLSELIVHGPPRRDLPTAYKLLKEDWDIDRDSILHLLPTPEDVDFTGVSLDGSSQPGITLKGWFFPSDSAQAPCAVVMAHGISDNRSGMFKYANAYRSCHCAILMYDHRAHYQSGPDDYVTGGILESEDLKAAHRFLAQKTGLPDEKIGWVGESWGGAAVLIAGGSDEIRPAFIHADSPYSDWYTAINERAVKMFGNWISLFFHGTFTWANFKLGIDYRDASPQRAAANIQVPTIILHSAADVETSPDQSQKIFDHLAHPEKSELHLLEWGSWHAQSAARRPAEYYQIVQAFLAEQVPDFCE
ncbi:MAG: prolyl oligopeptidase family serine peptidase [Bacteroidota bacterium]